MTIRIVRVRRGQNGILFDRVNDSAAYDNDCLFLSGWGLAMWRSSRNRTSKAPVGSATLGFQRRRF